MSVSLSSALTAFGAYARARRWASGRLTRADLEQHQRDRLRTFLDTAIGKVGLYRELSAGKTGSDKLALTDLPIVDKAAVMAEFDRFNVPEITAEQGWAAFSGSKSIGRYTVGASTGTSGNRGLFVVSEQERFLWLGTILAKAIPDFWRKRDRVAVILPQNTRLYDSANQTRLLTLAFFDLALGPEAWRKDLECFAPTVIIAPPKILRWMAETGVRIRPRRLFSAAETLDPCDRDIIEAGFALKLGEIYMATEGLFAVSCRHGVLHLAEDVVHFECLPVGEGLVSPLITDFTRRTQIMARYRMNDLLRLKAGQCSCGSPLQAVSEIVGRLDDCFELPAASGGSALVTPDVLRNAIVDSDRRITDYRLIQTGAGAVDLVLPPDAAPEAAYAAGKALQALFSRRGVAVELTLSRQTLQLDPGRKLRRIENRMRRGLKCES